LVNECHSMVSANNRETKSKEEKENEEEARMRE
jgi:hypothetical protein